MGLVHGVDVTQHSFALGAELRLGRWEVEGKLYNRFRRQLYGSVLITAVAYITSTLEVRYKRPLVESSMVGVLVGWGGVQPVSTPVEEGGDT